MEMLLEAILFAAGVPVSLNRLSSAVNADEQGIAETLRLMASRLRFDKRGIRIVEMDGMFQMVSSPEYADIIRKFLEERKPVPLSKAALEVLAITAYHQPVTRADIERIRGIDSTSTVTMLCERELLEEAGRLDVPGRPMRYRTTPLFLRTFGIKDLSELPDLEELEGQISLDGVITGETL